VPVLRHVEPIAAPPVGRADCNKLTPDCRRRGP
jgi:hypothetical protein